MGVQGTERLKRSAMPDRDADLALLSRLDLNLLAPLHAIVEERSVTRAAARVGLTQSAVSHILRRCRVLLADELLIRVGTTMELTARARDLQAPLAIALESIRGIVDPGATFVPERTTRQVTMAALSSSTATLLPPLLDELARTAPHLTLRVVALPPPGEDLLDLPDIDLVLRASMIPSPYQRTTVYRERWAVIADSGNPALEDPLTLEQLTAVPHVQYESHGFVMPYRVMEGMQLRWPIAITVDDFLLIPHLIRGSDRVAIVQERLAREWEAMCGIRIYPLPLDVADYTVDVIWNPRRYYDPLKPWFTERLRCATAGEFAMPRVVAP